MSSVVDTVFEQIRSILANRQQEATTTADHFLESLDQMDPSQFSGDDLYQRIQSLTDNYWQSVEHIEKTYLQQLVALRKTAAQQGIIYAQWHALLRQATGGSVL